MVLEFQPYFQPDRNKDRESLAGLNQTISGIGDDWQKYGQQTKENKMRQAYLDLAKQKQAREEADSGPLYSGSDSTGAGGSGMFTSGGTTSWNPSPLDIGRQPWAKSPNYGGGSPSGAPSPSSNMAQGTMGPQPQAPQYVDAGTPDTGWSGQHSSPAPQMMAPQSPQPGQPMHQPGADLTSHFNSWKQQGGGAYNHPEMGGVGQSGGGQNPMQNMDWSQFSRMNKNQREGYTIFSDQQRKQREEQDRYGTGASGLYSTPEQAAFQLYPNDSSKQKQYVDQAKQFYPEGRIPKSSISTASGGIRFDISQGEKASQFGDKRLTALGDSLDPSKQRAGAFGVSKQAFDRAERLESLGKAFPDGNLRRQEIEEIAIGLNAMLSGSNTGAQEQVKSLMPDTIRGNVQKTIEWLTNNPTGAQQQAIVNRMMSSVAREKATAADQIKRTQFQRIGRYADLEKSNPDGFANTLQSQGIDPEEYHHWKAGGYKPMSAVQSPDAGGQGGGGQQFSHTATGKDGQKIGWNGQQWVPVQ